MSWQTYVDNNLVGTGKVSKGAIYGLDGSVWATSPGFNVSGDEVKSLVAAFSDSSNIAANGLFLEGVKYVYLRTVGDSIYARHGATGVTLTKAKTCVLVGFYGENMQAGDCNSVVENLAQYLVSMNY
ncbi:profilin, required for normal timing of actin polymerization in response to thermal stress [Haplosporangium sp. Z 767]|nr:profilin, required for normal timing of actin polymerization in response to thermal stress [Haplosporangium sp. Z 11]KAF9194192.1 profilin, required for normal timing of actin polymerization in response to thermal stress [Haplosporangium sp. Z 767]